MSDIMQDFDPESLKLQSQRRAQLRKKKPESASSEPDKSTPDHSKQTSPLSEKPSKAQQDTKEVYIKPETNASQGQSEQETEQETEQSAQDNTAGIMPELEIKEETVRKHVTSQVPISLNKRMNRVISALRAEGLDVLKQDLFEYGLTVACAQYEAQLEHIKEERGS